MSGPESGKDRLICFAFCFLHALCSETVCSCFLLSSLPVEVSVWHFVVSAFVILEISLAGVLFGERIRCVLFLVSSGCQRLCDARILSLG